MRPSFIKMRDFKEVVVHATVPMQEVISHLDLKPNDSKHNYDLIHAAFDKMAEEREVIFPGLQHIPDINPYLEFLRDFLLWKNLIECDLKMPNTKKNVKRCA